MLQSCAGPQEQLKHQLAELGEEKQAGGIADTNTEKPYIAPVQEVEIVIKISHHASFD